MPDKPRADSAFIIATRNRPDELLVTIESLVAQTLLPKELCIVDSSDETPVRAKIEAMCDGVGLPLDYHHPAPRGLTIQRNIGIDRTSGDPVFFIDDDVFMAPDCHEEVLKEYGRWGPELGGVRATPMRPARPPLVSIWWRKLFGIGGWWPEASGKMRAGFWVEGISEAAGVGKIEYMTGWFMSFRREVLAKERFDEALSGYGHKEDVDMTYRASCDYVLVQTPKALRSLPDDHVAPAVAPADADEPRQSVLPAPQEHAAGPASQGGSVVGLVGPLPAERGARPSSETLAS